MGTNTEQLEPAGRLAMRQEGDLWVAHWAKLGTMEDAVILGSIAMAAVSGPEGFERKQAFMGIMRSFVGDALEAVVGARVEWPEPDGVPAPEHERAARA